MEPLRRARPWAASTTTAASPAVPAVSASHHTHFSNSVLVSHLYITHGPAYMFFRIENRIEIENSLNE